MLHEPETRTTVYNDTKLPKGSVNPSGPSDESGFCVFSTFGSAMTERNLTAV